MTPAQKRALAWLQLVGKATPSSARRAGHREATMDRLVAAGLVTAQRRRKFGSTFPVWTPIDPTDTEAP